MMGLSLLWEVALMIWRVFVGVWVLCLIGSTLVHAAPADKRKFFSQPSKVLWRVGVVLKVTRFDEARTDALRLVEQYGGKAYSEQIKVDRAGRKNGILLFRVPQEKRYEFLGDMHSLGTLYSQNISAPDVTEEFVDLGRRLRNLKAEEDQLLKILTGARHVLEVLQVQSHLFNVRVEQERIATRLGEIDMKSDTALFSISFFEPPPVREPVTPGGASAFLSRWWTYTALPSIKIQARSTFNEASQAVIAWTLGMRGAVPNVAWAAGMMLALLLCLRLAWRPMRDAIRHLRLTLRQANVPLGTLIAMLCLIYVGQYFMPPTLFSITISVLLAAAALKLLESPAARPLNDQATSRSISVHALQAIVLTPFAWSVCTTLFPNFSAAALSLVWTSLLLGSLTAVIVWLIRTTRSGQLHTLLQPSNPDSGPS
jgi:hypothetical protein